LQYSDAATENCLLSRAANSIQLNLSVVQSAILEASEQAQKLALRRPSCPSRYFSGENHATVEIIPSSKPEIQSDVMVCAENRQRQTFSGGNRS
jgi:hypothetical protein